ncbi:MAG: hypothetical protein Q8Q73_14325 [Stagnimonas sp.]|nr:hypothetical protein [Stagnimonas sp.]
MSRQRFEPAELFRIVAGLALEAVTARESSDDPEDRELIDLYRDALFQFEGIEHPLTACSAEIERLRAALAEVLPYAESRAEDLEAFKAAGNEDPNFPGATEAREAVACAQALITYNPLEAA